MSLTLLLNSQDSSDNNLLAFFSAVSMQGDCGAYFNALLPALNPYGIIDDDLPAFSTTAYGGGYVDAALPSFSAEAFDGGELEVVIGGEDVLIKSVIIDCAVSWGNDIGLRSVDFYNDGSIISNEHGTDFEAYATHFNSSDLAPWRAFDTTLSKLGLAENNSWLSTDGQPSRLICVFNTPKFFDEIRINNYHTEGTYTSRGAQDITIYISSFEITSTVYNEAIAPSGTEIFTGALVEHISSNEVDDQVLSLFDYGAAWFGSSLSLIMSGQVYIQGTFVSSLPSFSCQAEGVVSHETDDIAVDLPVFEIDIITGGFAQIDFPAFQMSGNVFTDPGMHLDATFPSLEIDLSVGGIVSSTMTMFSMAAGGGTELVANIEVGITSLQFVGAASRACEGGISASIPKLRTDNMVATVGEVGEVSTIFPVLESDGLVLTGVVGEIMGLLGELYSTGQGRPVGPGSIEAALPKLVITMRSGIVESKVLRFEKGKVR